MKILATAIILSVVFISSASAFDLINPTENDRKLMTFASLILIDYQQTVQILYEKDGHYELNPVLGFNPEREDLMRVGLAGLTLGYSINEIMSEGKLKDFLFDSVLATERLNIEENKQVLHTGKKTFECIMLVMTFDF